MGVRSRRLEEVRGHLAAGQALSASTRATDDAGREIGITATITPIGDGFDYVRETYYLVGAYGETIIEIRELYDLIDAVLARFEADTGMDPRLLRR